VDYNACFNTVHGYELTRQSNNVEVDSASLSADSSGSAGLTSPEVRTLVSAIRLAALTSALFSALPASCVCGGA